MTFAFPFPCASEISRRVYNLDRTGRARSRRPAEGRGCVMRSCCRCLVAPEFMKVKFSV
jgi:hypothetical protein